MDKMLTQKKKKWTQSKRLPVEAERESKWENRAKQDNKTTGGTTNVT